MTSPPTAIGAEVGAVVPVVREVESAVAIVGRCYVCRGCGRTFAAGSVFVGRSGGRGLHHVPPNHASSARPAICRGAIELVDGHGENIATASSPGHVNPPSGVLTGVDERAVRS